jgi:hypothetical protein
MSGGYFLNLTLDIYKTDAEIFSFMVGIVFLIDCVEVIQQSISIAEETDR